MNRWRRAKCAFDDANMSMIGVSCSCPCVMCVRADAVRTYLQIKREILLIAQPQLRCKRVRLAYHMFRSANVTTEYARRIRREVFGS
jgi:hypothetical protein